MRYHSTRNPIDAFGLDAGPELSTRLEPDFSHIDSAARISMSLVRTLRVPGDGRTGTVLSGLGRLP
ncbi:MAG TPA: hypothetical protein VJ925_13840, partial [Longimicrobiales bacterium]|nr:hypothetical protein [Longimicrobiales bacterium]